MTSARIVSALLAASLLAACGGGGSSSPAPVTNTPVASQPEEPAPPVQGPQTRPDILTEPFADYGTVLNILPPGQDDIGGISSLTTDIPGLGDLVSTLFDDLVAETGLVPALSKEPHFDDQLGLYDALVRSEPGLTDDQLLDYFKAAPLLPADGGNWESEQTVEAGSYQVAIKRDNFGVPHIFGDSRRDALFGVGYVTAADRLFLLDVLRRAGRGELSRFLGPADFSFDEDIAVNAPYREEDRTAMIGKTIARFGDDGAQVFDDATDYVAGLNQYVADARSGLLQVPVEYVAWGSSWSLL